MKPAAEPHPSCHLEERLWRCAHVCCVHLKKKKNNKNTDAHLYVTLEYAPGRVSAHFTVLRVARSGSRPQTHKGSAQHQHHHHHQQQQQQQHRVPLTVASVRSSTKNKCSSHCAVRFKSSGSICGRRILQTHPRD